MKVDNNISRWCRPEENGQYTTSTDTCTHQMSPIYKAQDSNPQKVSQNVADEEIIPAFPSSFTSLLMNYCTAASEGSFSLFYHLMSFSNFEFSSYSLG